jgi:hypothetical protein
MSTGQAVTPSGSSGQNRIASIYSNRRYAILFYSLLATLAACPLLSAVGLRGGVLELFLAVNLLAAVLPVTSGVRRRLLLGALSAVCLLQVVGLWFEHSLVSIASLLLWTVIALFAAGGAIRFAIGAKAVDSEHLYAALDAYLLFGVFLGVLYWALDRLLPDSLILGSQATDAPLSLPATLYFSFVTLVTLGYGDILPHNEVARGVAIVESVTGQLYLTVMVAHLVSLHVRNAKQTNDS